MYLKYIFLIWLPHMYLTCKCTCNSIYCSFSTLTEVSEYLVSSVRVTETLSHVNVSWTGGTRRGCSAQQRPTDPSCCGEHAARHHRHAGQNEWVQLYLLNRTEPLCLLLIRSVEVVRWFSCHKMSHKLKFLS